MENNIVVLTDREHILLRPSMYVGGISETDYFDYLYRGDEFTKCNFKCVPALLKIINEIIDNSFDIAIKTNFKGCNSVSINITSTSVEIKDNGTGIPVEKVNDRWMPSVAWGSAKSGSNFNDAENKAQIGLNGVGSFCTNCFSKVFKGISDDGKRRLICEFSNNAEVLKETLTKSTSHGVTVYFEPDLERFGLTEITKDHIDFIKTRLINMCLCFPNMKVKFNGYLLRVKNFDSFVQYFTEKKNANIIESENYSIAILPNESDEFQFYSFVNGLKIPDGGTHVDCIVNPIVNNIRDKLIKKYKTIKPADIRNKLFLIVFMRNFANAKFSSQTKEKITNSIAEVNSYFKDLDLDTFSKTILKNENIIEPIIEIFKIKEEFKKKQELKNLDKAQKRIKSDKYTPATKLKKYLVIVEGDSAQGGLMPILGREYMSYYKLKGKPLNVLSCNHTKFMANKELSELYKIIKNEEYQYIVYATDSDVDGYHIRALLSGFVHKYLNDYENKIYMLETPVKATFKNDKIQKWSYSLKETLDIGKGEVSHYYKGLGTWNKDDLKTVIKIDGFNKMLVKLDFNDSEKSIEAWLDTNSENRKVKILENNFSISDV